MRRVLRDQDSGEGAEEMKKTLLLAAFAATMLIVIACANPKDGRGLFLKVGCTKCHNFKGNGSGIIDLSSVTSRRTDQWIYDQITRPKSHDPNTGMPSFGDLTETEVHSIIGFFHSDGK